MQQNNRNQRPADLSVKSNWSWLHGHVTLLGARQIKMWHALIGCAFLMGMSVGLLTLSDSIAARTKAAAPSSIENTATMNFKNVAGAQQPLVTSNRVVTNVQDTPPQCDTGAWQNVGCGQGTCSATQMRQTRTTNPEGCAEGSRCVTDSSQCQTQCQTGSWQNAGCGQGNCPDNKMQQTRSVSPANCAVNSQCVTNSQCEGSGGDRVVLSIEAESARLSGAMVIRNDSKASGGKYIIYNRQRPKDPHAQADLTFTVPKAGDYTFWGMTLAPDGLTDSFWIQVDGQPADPDIWYTKPVSSSWRWRQMTRREGERDVALRVRLSAGSHTLSLIGREETGLDKVIITNDLSYKP